MVTALGYAAVLMFAVWATCTLGVLAYLFGWDDGYEQGWDDGVRAGCACNMGEQNGYQANQASAGGAGILVGG